MKNLYSEPNFSCGDYEFTQQEILNLQSLFLTNGFHFITLKDFTGGRSLIVTLLSAMPNLWDIAVLAQEDSLPNRFANIYPLLKDNQLQTEENIEDFLINHFYYDAMWIEALPELYVAEWYADFEHSLVNLNIDQQIPIIVTHYNQ